MLLRPQHDWQAVGYKHLTRTDRLDDGSVGSSRAARDLDDITFARHDLTVTINDLQWIEAGGEPGGPSNMCPDATRFDPDVVLAVHTSPAVEHADHPRKKPRFARPPT